MRSEQEVNRAIERYSNTVRRLCMIHLKNEADTEDIFQTVFLKYVLRSVSFESEEHEKAWLIRTALQRASDIRRKAEQRNVPLEDVTEPAAPESPGEELRSAVRALPEMYGAVIHLHYYEGYSIKEIAKLLGLPAATVGTRLARGRERLRQMLKEDVV